MFIVLCIFVQALYLLAQLLFDAFRASFCISNCSLVFYCLGLQ